MFAILMYLFENYMDNSVSLNADQATLLSELEQAGFSAYEISQALDWLEGLERVQETVQLGSQLTTFAMRHYTQEEKEHLGIEGRGFLLYLEQVGILDPVTREIVIDRLMVLNRRLLDLGGIKWVVLIALFNQPEKQPALTILQDMVLSEAYDVLH